MIDEDVQPASPAANIPNEHDSTPLNLNHGMFKEEEIPDIFQKAYKPQELPQYVSSKLFIADSMTEGAVEHALEVHSSLLREVTTNREQNIFRGVLQEDKVFSQRRKGKGAAFSSMGVQSPDGFTFYPEEALLQAEFGVLEVFLDADSRVPLCIQSLYEILLPVISLEFYQTYSHLIKLGYIVNRVSKRLFAVRKPKSKETDFTVVVLEQSREFPELCEILDLVQEAGTTCIKVARVTDGNVYFYTMAVVDFPNLSQLT